MISFIIVTYNSAATIEDCLRSVIEDSSSTAKIIVIDNASTDASREIVQKFTEVTLVSLPENIGFGGANQVGCNASRGEIVVFLNPDTVVQDGFAKKVNAFFQAHPSTGILGCLIRNTDGSLERTGNTFPTFFSLLYEHSAYKYLFPKSRAYRKFIIDGWDRTTARTIDAVSGACFAMQRETLEHIGGFDPGFFLYFEEFDLAKRVSRIGKRVFYEPSIQVVHSGQASTTQLASSKRQQIYNTSCRRYVQKYHGRPYARLLWLMITVFNAPKYLVNLWRPAKRDRKI